MSTGLNGVLGIGQETTFGVNVDPTHFIDMKSEDLKGDEGMIKPDTCSGQRSRRRILPGPISLAGGFNILAQLDGFLGLALKGLFGQVTTIDLTGGAYKHKYTALNQSKLPSYTVYKDMLAEVWSISGFTFSEVTLDGKVGAEVDLAFKGVAKQQSIISRYSSTITYPSSEPITWADASVTWAGAANTEFENMSLKINNDIEAVRTHNNSRFINRAVAKTFEVEGSFEVEYNDDMFRNPLWGSASNTTPQRSIYPVELKISYVSLEEISSSGQYYSLIITIPSTVLTAVEPVNSGPNNRIMMPMAFTAKTDGTKSIQVELINGDASY